MAVVPDKRLALSHRLSMLKTNWQIVRDALQQLVSPPTGDDDVLSLVIGDEVKDYSAPIKIRTSADQEDKFVVIHVPKNSSETHESHDSNDGIQRTFSPKDLVALLNNLEAEVNSCETSIREENDKRRKYKIDDSRRTHNYDEFICTFLLMLADQGKMADLVGSNANAKTKLFVSSKKHLKEKLNNGSKVNHKKVKNRRRK